MPCGLYILSTRKDDQPLGLVASFVMQVGLEPPRVAVAVGTGRGSLEALRETGGFTLSILDEGSSACMGGFFKAPPEGQTPFDSLETCEAPSGLLVLTDSLAWLDCRVVGEFDGGDHAVVFGEVQAGAQLHPGEPSIHLRKNGLSY
jgi:flavin reductase (DIM6/NTAB) family NADH-FMN oxidoreductase RutF